jgi:hypothetical protein
MKFLDWSVCSRGAKLDKETEEGWDTILGIRHLAILFAFFWPGSFTHAQEANTSSSRLIKVPINTPILTIPQSHLGPELQSVIVSPDSKTV